MSEEDKKEEKILTIRDFKVMIEGMDMVLGENWYPTEEQWKRIRNKIDLLLDSSERPVTNTRMMYPESNVVLPGGQVDNLIAGFPQVPVASDVPIGEAPVAPSAFDVPATPPAAPEVEVVNGEAVKVHKSDEFI